MLSANGEPKMRSIMVSALSVAAVAMTLPVEAQSGQGYYAGQDFGELNKLEREFEEKIDKERRECRKKRYEANDRGELSKAQRECREKLAELEREYRKKLREERLKFYDD